MTKLPIEKMGEEFGMGMILASSALARRAA
jgi:hypothetical protein